jgi:type VI secretion system secreted protein VgrG
MQEVETRATTVSGESTCRVFNPGFRFKLNDHYRGSFNAWYTLTAVHHVAKQGANYMSGEDVDFSDVAYSNTFECIPHPTPFRPPRTTPIPVVRGSQTAIVVGPPGEEIYVDLQGRVKVQFHWDRDGQYDDKSSCWIRVAQAWAGKQWGAIFLPRIGQEVIVDFLEGDPDRPLITGRLYNGVSMPPYVLPDEKTKSTIKSYSSMGGNGFNEIRFEDMKGSEQIFIHAEKDEEIRIKHDRVEFVGNESHLTVTTNHFEKIGGDCHFELTGDLNEKVDGSVSLEVGRMHQEKTGVKFAVDAGREIHLKSGMTVVVESGTVISLKVGGNFINIDSSGIYIQGAMVNINSGGRAGVGSGASPTAPQPPREPETGVVGELAQLPPAKAPRPAITWSSGALALQNAARGAMPFCAICNC